MRCGGLTGYVRAFVLALQVGTAQADSAVQQDVWPGDTNPTQDVTYDPEILPRATDDQIATLLQIEMNSAFDGDIVWLTYAWDPLNSDEYTHRIYFGCSDRNIDQTLRIQAFLSDPDNNWKLSQDENGYLLEMTEKTFSEFVDKLRLLEDIAALRDAEATHMEQTRFLLQAATNALMPVLQGAASVIWVDTQTYEGSSNSFTVAIDPALPLSGGETVLKERIAEAIGLSSSPGSADISLVTYLEENQTVVSGFSIHNVGYCLGLVGTINQYLPADMKAGMASVCLKFSDELASGPF